MKTAVKNTNNLEFNSDLEKIDFIADVIQLDLLHDMVVITEAKKVDIAKKMSVSNSFITQLFSGDKRLSLNHVAALAYYFDLNVKLSLEKKHQCKIINYLQRIKEDKNIQVADKGKRYSIGVHKELAESKQKSV